MAQHQVMPTNKVWVYGAIRPTRGIETLWEQLRGARAYRGVLVDLENRRRDELDALLFELSGEYRAAVETAQRRCDELAQEGLSKAKLKEESRAAYKPVVEQRKALLRRLRSGPDAAELKRRLGDTSRAARGRLKRQLLEDLSWAEDPDWVRYERLNAEHEERQREARAASGLLHGTYSLIEASVDQARGDKPWGRLAHRSLDQVRVGVQCQGGVTKGRFEIDPLPADQWETRRGRRQSTTLARVRIQSDDKRRPVWCELPIVQHRPIPEGAAILYAYVSVRREGVSEVRYELHLVLAIPDAVEAASTFPAKAEAVGLDLGWRVVPEGIRVATYRGSDGSAGTFVIPKRFVERLAFADRLRSTADLAFEAVRDEVARVRKDKPRAFDPVFVKATMRVAQWRRHHLLARAVRGLSDRVLGERAPELWRAWKAKRQAAKAELWAASFDEVRAAFPGESEQVQRAIWLLLWQRQDKHLLQWWHNQRRKALAWRNELFRVEVTRLARRFERIVLEKETRGGGDMLMDLRRWCVERETDTPADDNARAVRVRAAPGEFRAELSRKVGTERMVLITAANTTRRCHVCGEKCEWDQKVLTHQCEHCLAVWDQDHNAAINLLCEHLGGAPSPGPSRKVPKTPRKPGVGDVAAE